MTEFYTIKPIEWEQRANDFHAKNSILPIDIFLSLVDLQTYNVWLGTTLVGENLPLTEAKLLAEQGHQKLIKKFLNPITEYYMKPLTPKEALQAIKDGKKVEYLYGEEEGWYEIKDFDFIAENLLDSYYLSRLDQEMIAIGDVSFPKPETSPLKMGTVYWYIESLSTDLCLIDTWDDMKEDYHRLQTGSIHLTEENAIAHAKALIKLSGGTYE